MASVREQRRAERKRGAVSHSNQDVDFALSFPSLPLSLSEAPELHIGLPSFPSHELHTAIETEGLRTPADDVIKPAPRRALSLEGASRTSANTSAKRQKLDVEPAVELELRTEPGIGKKHSQIQGDVNQFAKHLATETEEFRGADRREVVGSLATVLNVPKSSKKVSDARILPQHATPIPRTQRGPSLLNLEGRPDGIIETGVRLQTSPKSTSRVRLLPVKTTDRSPSPEQDAEDEHDNTRTVPVIHAGRGEPELLLVQNDEETAEEIDDLQAAVRLRAVQKRALGSQRPTNYDASPKHVDRENSVEEGHEMDIDRSDNFTLAIRDHTRPGTGVPKLTPTMGFARLATGQSFIAGESRASPAHQRQPRTRKVRRDRKRPENKSRESVTIPVHRFMGPLILVEESDTDADILNRPIPFSKRGNINTVDVLAEFSQETSDTILAVFEEQALVTTNSAGKRELLVKLRAVKAWREMLGVDLYEMAINLDENHRLQRYVTSSAQQLKQLRRQITELRDVRETIAIKADHVRMQHEQNSCFALAEQTLRANIDDVQLAYDNTGALRTADDDKTPPMLSLSRSVHALVNATVATPSNDAVSSRVRSFNTFLERSATALERKI